MAGKSGWQYRTPRCGRCGKVGAMYSVYSQRHVCGACLAFERTVAQAQAEDARNTPIVAVNMEECGCVLPEQSCPTCATAAASVYALEEAW